MKKYLLPFLFIALVGCSDMNATPENRCCMENNCSGVVIPLDKVKCLYDMVKTLEHKAEIDEIKHRYECGNGKETKE